MKNPFQESPSYKLGVTARKMAKRIKKGANLGKYKPYYVFVDTDQPSDIVGHLFYEAFQSNAIFHFSEQKRIGPGLVSAILSDLHTLNDLQGCKDRRRKYVRYLNEIADFCLNEGQYDSAKFPDDKNEES